MPQEMMASLAQMDFRLRQYIRNKIGAQYYVTAIYVDHPLLQTAAIAETEEGRCFWIPFTIADEADETTLELAPASDWREVILTYTFLEKAVEPEEPEPLEEAERVAESTVGEVIGVIEGETAEDPLQLDIIPIRPGWGNRHDNFYYPAETVKNFAHVWEGAKMYATDHRPDEKSVRTEVSQVLKSPVGYTDDGIPIARVGIFDPAFAKMVRNREKLGILDGLHCSIYATATAGGDIEENGRKGRRIVAFHRDGANIDWVTQAGAGGQALRTVSETEDNMDSKKEKLEEVAVREEQEDPQAEEAQDEALEIDVPESLSATEVSAIVDVTNLPELSRNRLKELSYTSVEAVTAAVQREIKYVKELTGSGKPVVGTGSGNPASVSAEEINKRKSAANRRWLPGRRVKEV